MTDEAKPQFQISAAPSKPATSLPPASPRLAPAASGQDFADMHAMLNEQSVDPAQAVGSYEAPVMANLVALQTRAPQPNPHVTQAEALAAYQPAPPKRGALRGQEQHTSHVRALGQYGHAAEGPLENASRSDKDDGIRI